MKRKSVCLFSLFRQKCSHWGFLSSVIKLHSSPLTESMPSEELYCCRLSSFLRIQSMIYYRFTLISVYYVVSSLHMKWHSPQGTYEVLYLIFRLLLPVSSTSPNSRTSLERPVFSRASCSSIVRNLHTDKQETKRKKNLYVHIYNYVVFLYSSFRQTPGDT